MRALLACLVVTVTAALGCSSDGAPDISGLYMVASDTANGTACGNETEVQGAPSYVMIQKEEIMGSIFFELYTCPSSDTTTCVSGDGLYVTSRPDGWHGFLSFASGDATDCALGYVDYQALYDPSPAILQLVNHTYAQNGATPSCTSQEAEDLSSSMPCVSSSTLVATLVK